jgi:hypothetical protein
MSAQPVLAVLPVLPVFVLGAGVVVTMFKLAVVSEGLHSVLQDEPVHDEGQPRTCWKALVVSPGFPRNTTPVVG